ncbi:MAG: alpha/beta hydrolase [Rhodoferax sp.]|nr:alpha/beta hydrolase [Rhodoferax sp.]MCP5263139.1 alpha/beta hydrolase [Rhodoferax sp.]
MTPDPAAFDAASPVAERERAYSPSSCIGGDYRPFVQAYVDRSAAVRQRHTGRCGLAYGPAASQTLDLFLPPPTRAGAPLPPLLVFIHGGYWQELSKNESLFAAEDCLAAGAAFAAVDYTLAPHATVEQMVRECRQALRWLHAHAAELGFDGRRIVVAGSSAGAHLSAMCCLRGWPGDADLPPGLPAAAVLVSGVYELAPLIGTSINAAPALTPESAARVSPLRFDLSGVPPVLVCWGDIETDAFKRQSQAFADGIAAATGRPVPRLEVPGRNHFDVILDLARTGSALGDGTLGLLQ